MPKIIVIIDELADLMMVSQKKSKIVYVDLLRWQGPLIHLCATQRPSWI